MTNPHSKHPIVSHPLTVALERGVCATAARKLRDTLRTFDSTATLRNGKGRAANVQRLLDVLMLEISRGDSIFLVCEGPAAIAAHQALKAILEGRAESPTLDGAQRDR